MGRKKALEKILEAQNLLNMIEDSMSKHKPGKLYFATTKLFLELYEPLYAELEPRSLPEQKPNNRSFEELVSNMDFVLTLPENAPCDKSYIYALNHRETAEKIIRLVNAGLNNLKKSDEDLYNLICSRYINRHQPEISEEKPEIQNAITGLSIIIFGPLGERWPGSVFADEDAGFTLRWDTPKSESAIKEAAASVETQKYMRKAHP